MMRKKIDLKINNKAYKMKRLYEMLFFFLLLKLLPSSRRETLPTF